MPEQITKTFHPKQWEVLNSSAQFVLCVAGIQSGKTTVGCSLLVKEIEADPSKDYLIAAPTYKILQQSTLKKFFQEYPQYRRFYKVSENVISHPKGGNIFIRSTDIPENLEGMTLKGAWLDEAGMMKTEVWTYIQARVSIQKGRVFMTTTPYSMNWVYKDVYKAWQAGDKNMEVFQWSSKENPYFPKEEFDRVKASMDPVVFEMRYLGNFRKRHGAVYPDFNDKMVGDKPVSPLGGLKHFNTVIAGIDWGYSAPCAIVVLGLDADNHYWLLDEFYARNKTTSEIINKARNFESLYKINRFYADSAEPDRIEEARRSGLYVTEANKDIKNGIDRCRQIIKENRLHVNRDCKNFIDEMENYHYPEEEEEKFNKDTPVKKDDHLMDAMRYAIYTFDPTPLSPQETLRVQFNRLKGYQFN
jgi:phage terminase large subunit